MSDNQRNNIHSNGNNNNNNNNNDVISIASTKRKFVTDKCEMESSSPLHFDDVHVAYKSLKAETIEVVPEIIAYDDDDDSEYDDDNNADDDNEHDHHDEDDDIDLKQQQQHRRRHSGIEKTTKSMRNFYDYNDNEQDDFDEYGYQVKWNGTAEPILFDNSEIRKMDMTDDEDDADYDEDDDDDDDDDGRNVDATGNVILIESEDDGGGDSGESGGSGSVHRRIIGNSSSSSRLNANHGGDTGGDRKMYECDICFRKVASSYNLKRHMMIHTGEKPYSCDLCLRRFREFSDLKKHRRVHSTEKQFKCMVCHRNPPSATNATKCSACENSENAQKSQDSSSMEQIIPRIDGNKKAFVCNYCERAFGSSSNLKRHVMIHTGEKPFTCGQCQRSFREMSTLKKHSFTHRNHMAALASFLPATQHQQQQQQQQLRPPSPPLKCYVCPKSFTDANQFKQHVLSHSDAQHDLPEITMKPVTVQQRHNSKIYHHKCPKCNKIFYESSKLMVHICSAHKVNGTTSAALHTAKTSSTSTIAAAVAAVAAAAAAATATAKTTLTSKAIASLRKPASSPPPLIPINRTTFAAIAQKRQHQQPHHHQSYFCRICSKKFRSQQHLLSHQLTHD